MTADRLAAAKQRRAEMIAAANAARAKAWRAADRVLAEAVHAAYDAGMSTAEVCEVVDMHPKGGLAKLMRRAGMPRPRGNPAWTAKKS